jgi:type IV conjugative transfer system protein TraL
MSDPHYLPKTLDAPMRLAILTLDEAALFFTPFLVLTFLCNALIVGFTLGVIGIVLLKKLKGVHGHYYAWHLCYWYCPRLLKLRFTPDSEQRDYIG